MLKKVLKAFVCICMVLTLAISVANKPASTYAESEFNVHFENSTGNGEYDVEWEGTIHTLYAYCAVHGSIKPGTLVTLTATPNENCKFVGWTKGGKTISTDNPATITIGNGEVTYDAVFEPISSYNLKVTCSNGGVISASNKLISQVNEINIKCSKNEEIDLQAIPDDRYEFVCWKDESGNIVSKDAYYNLNVNADTVLYAVFDKVHIWNLESSQEATEDTMGLREYICIECGIKKQAYYVNYNFIINEYWKCYNQIKDNKEGIYTEESYKAYADAMNVAREYALAYTIEVEYDDYTEALKEQTAVTSALKALQAAKAGLVKADSTACEHDYVFSKVIQKATKDTCEVEEWVCTKCGATIQEYHADNSELNQLIKRIEASYNGEEYTEESWRSLQNILTRAKDFIAAHQDTRTVNDKRIIDDIQTEINNYIEIILECESNLVKVGEESTDPTICDHAACSWLRTIQDATEDEAELVEWVCENCGAVFQGYNPNYSELDDNAERIKASYNEEDYTAESWQNLQSVLDRAYDVIKGDYPDMLNKEANDNAQKEASALIKQLLEAEANLVKIGEDKKEEEVVVPDQDEETTPVTPDTPVAPVTPVTPDTPSEGSNTTNTVVPNTGIYASSNSLLGIAGLALVVALKKKKED